MKTFRKWQKSAAKDIYNQMGFKASQKEAKNISKTMERMQKDFTLQQGKVYGTYALPEVIRRMKILSNIPRCRSSRSVFRQLRQEFRLSIKFLKFICE